MDRISDSGSDDASSILAGCTFNINTIVYETNIRYFN